jgi:hypothetical protein
LGIITVINEALRDFVELRPLVLGVILILFTLFLPGGVESILEKASAFAERLKNGLGESKIRWITTIYCHNECSLGAAVNESK